MLFQDTQRVNELVFFIMVVILGEHKGTFMKHAP